jgi:uncharacterized protein DUF6929
VSPVRRAAFDPSMRAQVRARRPLHYAGGADAAADRAAHVRAGSALAWTGDRLLVVQDDANVVAAVDLASGRVEPLLLPAGRGGLRQFDAGRGNKADKLDLEACILLGDGAAARLIAFGSGSTPAREQIAILPLDGSAPRLVDASRLYATLHRPDFAGAELNIEGALSSGGDLLLLQRGNGTAGGPVAPLDATLRLDLAAFEAFLAAPDRAPVPALRDLQAYDLGAIDGCRLTFTDAAALPDGTLVYLAAAEASPDTYGDGPVSGVTLGLLGDPPRQTLLLDERAAPLRAKTEGLVPHPTRPGHLLAIVDRDDPTAAAELLEIALTA